MTPLVAAVILAWIALVVLGLAFSGLLRQVLFLMERMEDLAASVEAGGRPEAATPAPNDRADGDRSALASFDLSVGPKGGIVLFVSGRCPRCTDALAAAPMLMDPERPITVATRDLHLDAVDLPPADIVTEAHNLFAALTIGVTPAVVVLGPDRQVIATRVLRSEDVATELADTVLATHRA